MSAELREAQWLSRARQACAKQYIIIADFDRYEFDCILVREEEDFDAVKAECLRRNRVIVKVCDVQQPLGQKPKVGDVIYLSDAISIDDETDADSKTSIVTISSVTIGIVSGEPAWFVELQELPGHPMNYDDLIVRRRVDSQDS